MRQNMCISCGFIIRKSALHDPYLCGDCENLMIGADEGYNHLDSKVLEVVKMISQKKPSEEHDFEDFFNRFSFENYTDLMSQFEDK